MRLPLFISFLILLTLLVPAVSVAWLWIGKYKSRTDWLLRVVTAGAAVFFSLFTGLWVFLSWYLKWVVKVLFVVAIVKTFPKLEDRKIFGKRNSKGRVDYYKRFAVLGVFLVLDLMALKGGYFRGEPYDLSFPLKEGKFFILQGGSTRVTNLFHGSDPSQEYALDIVKLAAYGNRAKGIFPKTLNEYGIYGEVVFSPCTGKVLEAVDGLPDNEPGKMDKENPSGNHILLECGQGRVLMAHLQKGSIKVKENTYVRDGQPLASAGNSGYSLEPHLHIQAVSKNSHDTALPMLFNGKFLKLNAIFKN